MYIVTFCFEYAKDAGRSKVGRLKYNCIAWIVLREHCGVRGNELKNQATKRSVRAA